MAHNQLSSEAKSNKIVWHDKDGWKVYLRIMWHHLKHELLVKQPLTSELHLIRIYLYDQNNFWIAKFGDKIEFSSFNHFEVFISKCARAYSLGGVALGGFPVLSLFLVC